MTITWHANDLEISHEDPKEATNMILWLDNKHRKMRVPRGKVYDYLGMDLDCTVTGLTSISTNGKIFR